MTGQLKIDATPPTGVTASFSRGPDYNGWYNHPVTISWSGTDPTSGIAACSSLTYGGPGNGAATVGGGCTDMAGNSAGFTAHLAYDATPPVLSQVRERSTPTANNLRLELVERLRPGRRPAHSAWQQGIYDRIRRQRRQVQ